MSLKNEAYITVVAHLENAAKLVRMAGIEVGQDPEEPLEARVQGKPDPDGLAAMTQEIYDRLSAEVTAVRALLPETALAVLTRRDVGPIA